MLMKYARKAGLEVGRLSSHLLRHSHATRQIELGTSMKLVGDILGHRHPQTTSLYTRSALRPLRTVALSLPYD